MRRHYQLKCYVDREELDRINKQAKDMGFASTSSYVRCLLRNSFFNVQAKVDSEFRV